MLNQSNSHILLFISINDIILVIKIRRSFNIINNNIHKLLNAI